MFNVQLFNGGGGSGSAAIPPSVSAYKLVHDAYRELGVSRAGQAVSPEMLDDGFQRLNEMVDSWNTERLFIWAIRQDIYELTAGVSTYILGDLEESGIRPTIQGVSMLPAGQTQQHQLRILTLDEFRSGQYGWYSDNAFPHANVWFPPAQAGQQLIIYSWQRLSGFESLDAQYSFPPGYAQALKWSLAAQLAPSARIYAKIPDVMYKHIETEMTRSKFVIKRLNAPELLMTVDSALGCGCGYDITIDGYR